MSVNVESIIRLTPSIRKKATANVWTRKDEAFDMDFLYSSLNQIIERNEGSNDSPLFEQLRQIDLTQFSKESPGLNRFFTCSFFAKRYAWISQNEKGEYRYFSKIKDGYGFYAFDLFDLMCILLNKTSRELIRYLEESYPYNGMSQWSMKENEKIEENLTMLSTQKLMDTPNLQRIMRGGVEVLQQFLQYGRKHINGKHLSNGEHAVFFMSTQYFKEHYFPLKSLSTLNQWVNLFAVLGLIEKTSQVPVELQVEAEKQQALKKKHNHVSFYIIPAFKKVFHQAEIRAKELVEQRISYHQLTKKMVLSVFGKAVHDHVYIQKTHGRKSKQSPKTSRFSMEWLDMYFTIQLSERGVVSKRDLEGESTLSKTAFSRYWTELLVRHHCEVDTPTEKERTRFGWNYRQVVARPISVQVESTVWKDETRLPWDDESFGRLFADDSTECMQVS